MRAPENERLAQACEAKRRAIDEYFWAVRRGKDPRVLTPLLIRAQAAEAAMTAALEPFIVRTKDSR